MAAPFAVAKSEVSGIPFRVADREPYWLQVGQDDWRKGGTG